MAITKTKKEEILTELKDIFFKSPSAVFVRFKGLSVSLGTDMRRDLRERGVGFRVAKKTLLKKSLNEMPISGEQPALEGETAFVYTESDDPISPAREIYSFQKKYKGTVSIQGGYFESKYMDREEMTEIATIPTRQTLIGQIANIINSPIQGLVRAINQIAEKR